VFWKARWETSIDGSGTPYRTLVCYKETHADAKIDPLPNVWTGSWRDPTFSPPADGGRPENALTGTLFMVNGDGTGGTAITVPAADGKLRFWRNTTVADLAPGQVATLTNRTLGFEWNEVVDNGFLPAGLMELSHTTTYVQAELTDYGNNTTSTTATHSLTLYRAASGALVFSAGTIQWSFGLDGDHDWLPSIPDPRIQQATVNLFADMGVQPLTLQAGLRLATESTDFTAPTSIVSANGATVTVISGQQSVVYGTASDTGGGVVAGVEVSIDGGDTWHPADGRESWQYTWTSTFTGAVTVLSRAVDDSGNLEVPQESKRTAVVEPSPVAYTVWSAQDAPLVDDNGDGQAVTLGMKFSASNDGYITGVEFYKSLNNTGAHVGSLWSSDGTLLASATFSNETAEGWQQVTFSTPVEVNANEVYVVSYFAPNGHYAIDNGYFTGNAVQNGPLRALASGEDGSNGVAAAGASPTFPQYTYLDSNYWVSPIFTDTLVTGITPADSTSNVPITNTVDIAFATDMNLSTITPSTVQLLLDGSILVKASVTYDAVHRIATIGPANPLADLSQYTVVVRGGANGVESTDGTLLPSDITTSFRTAINVGPAESTWHADLPKIADGGDAQSVEVGMKFQVATDGYVTGLQFYKSAANQGTHVGSLWTSTGVLLARVTFVNELVNGWQQMKFSAPVYVSANTTYVISYFAPQGHYSIDVNYFSGTSVQNGSVIALASGAGDLNGVALYASAPAFPTNSYLDANYWVAPLFVPSVIASITPSDHVSAVATDSTVQVKFVVAMDATTITSSTIQLLTAENTVVAAVVTYNATTRTATLTPAASLVELSAYHVVVYGGAGGVKAQSGQLLPTDVQSTFETGVSLGPSYSVWNDNTVPTLVDNGDSKGAELGMKFRVSVAGFVTGVRFYKSQYNTGVHVGDLWSSTGVLLASVTFTNETADGWQRMDFSSPVYIQANTTYVISYNAPRGHYAIDYNYFTGTGAQNGPVQALASGVDGTNGVAVYSTLPLFPQSTYLNSNYWVDPVFAPSLITSFNPSDGAAINPAVKPLQIQFGVAMDPATINSQTIVLLNSDNTLISISVAYDPTTHIATFAPQGLLNASMTYRIVMRGGAAGIRALSGQALAGDITTSFYVDATPPTVTSLTPAAGRLNVTTGVAPTVTFSEAIDPATVNASTLYLMSGNAIVTSSVSYNATTNTATLAPSLALANSATYTIVVVGGASGVKDLAGNALAANATSSFTTAAPSSYSVWSATALPVVADNGDTTAVEVGMKFRSDVDGFITGIRFYKSALNTGTHVGHLWSSTGVLLATATFTSESGSGWQQVTFSTPVAIKANTTYVASYHTNAGHYAIDPSYFATTGVDSGPLHALATGVDGVNDVATASAASAFPKYSYQSSNYWVDVVFTKPLVASVSPTASATNVPTNSNVVVTFSAAMAAASINTTSIQLQDPSGALVAATVTYNATDQTATLQPTSALKASTTFKIVIKGGASGVTSQDGSTMPADTTSSFTTVASIGPTYSVWSATALPVVADNGDTTAVEVGMKFRSDVDGFITGIRFYKSALNTGTHIGDLWSSTGVLLATATFTSESSSGWQQVTFSTPVAIKANTTYVASYHTNAGHYAIDTSYFATTGVDSGPLHALAAGVDGVNGVAIASGTSAFPKFSYLSSNYWVDVVMAKSLVSSISPSNGATGVATTTTIMIAFNTAMDPATITTNAFTLTNSAGTAIAYSLTYNSATRTAVLTPLKKLATSTTFTIRIKGGSAGVKDALGENLAGDETSLFTTATK
jgi:hypothetical protein